MHQSSTQHGSLSTEHGPNQVQAGGISAISDEWCHFLYEFDLHLWHGGAAAQQTFHLPCPCISQFWLQASTSLPAFHSFQ